MFSTTIESIIWGGEKNIPPIIKRKLQRNDDLDPIDPPQKFFESVPDEPYEEQRDDEATESDEPEVDHYEETMNCIELNNQSLIS